MGLMDDLEGKGEGEDKAEPKGDEPKDKKGGILGKIDSSKHKTLIQIGIGLAALIVAYMTYKAMRNAQANASTTAATTTPSTTSTGTDTGDGGGGWDGGYGSSSSGLAGATGAAGTNGTNGTNGIDGLIGPAGATGATGATGPTGAPGTTVKTDPITAAVTLFTNAATAPANPGSTTPSSQTPQQALANTPQPVSTNTSVFTAAQAAKTEVPMSTHAPAATVSTHAVIVPNTKQTATSSGPGMNYAK